MQNVKKFSSATSIFLLLALCSVGAFADGTETLGPPSVPTASGTGIVAAGTGLAATGGAGPETISFNVPAGATVNQVLLYWEGSMIGNLAGDDTIVVDGNPVTGTLIGGPAYFFSFQGDIYFSAFRADITSLGLVGPGGNSLQVGGLTFTSVPHGAGVVVIFDDGVSDPADIQLRDGLDLAFSGFPPPRQSTVLQSFSFAPAGIARVANLANFFASVVGEDGAPRPTVVNIRVLEGGTEVANFDQVNMLNSLDGDEWDTLNTLVAIPANADGLTVQALSEDRNGTGELPASLAWIGSALSVPPVPGIEIDIRKETEGPDTRVFPSGSDVTFTIVVTNKGDVELTNVAVTDEQAPGCANDNIPDLAPNGSFSYSCTVPNVTDSFENEACVSGEANGTTVDDCDPSTVEIIDIDIRKQAEGPDSRTFPSGSDVTFEIVVTNTGDEDLVNVQVTDAQAPGCARNIGDLAAGASVAYSCTVPNVTASFDNEACVSGDRDGVPVSDCDPSSVEIEAAGQGCTPGYWKNHLDSWPPTGFSPGQSVESVFASAAAFPALASASLHDALQFGGGPSVEDAARILLRAAVAALLNASHPAVDYTSSPAAIISDVNAALASGNRNTILTLATMLDIDNNLGCPLN